MPSPKIPSPFDVEGKEPPKEKKPTIKQFIKSLPKDATFPLLSRIEVIWLPGNWNNYTIQCVDFRVSISEANPLYKPLDTNVIKFLDRETGVLLQVDDSGGNVFRLVESADYVSWRRIGNAGVAITWDKSSN